MNSELNANNSEQDVTIESSLVRSEGHLSGDDPLIGCQLGERYEVHSVIAGGGMGVVYRGRHILMDKIVAIKVLNAVYANEPQALARFQQEAKIACQLSHPNIVTIHDFGVHDNRLLYLVMDLVEGQTLAQLLDDKTYIPVERMTKMTVQLCDALEYAHDQDLIHRDLKPGNIMVLKAKDGSDQIKILDFGLAKFIGEGKQQALSQTGFVMGTGFYMSPEQCRGKKADVRSEMYAVGCVLYESLTGIPPFVGENVLETCQKQIEEAHVPMAVVRPDLQIPAALEAIVTRLLQKDPDSRFQSASELRTAITALAGTNPAEVLNANSVDVGVAGAIGSGQAAAVMPPPETLPVGEQRQATPTQVSDATAAPSVVPPIPGTTRAISLKNTLPIVAIVAIGVGMVIYAMLPRHTGWLAAGSEKANNVPPAAPLLTSAAPLTTSAAPLTTSAAPTVESKTWTGYYRQASAAFDHEKYSVAEKALRSAIVEARHSGNNSELVQSLRKLQDVFYVQENFKAGDALDPEIRKLAGSSSGPTAAQSTKPSAGMAEAAQPQDDRIARLALSCHKKGQCDTAVSLLEHSVEISKKIYGVNSVKTADRLEELATLHLALDESAKAQPIMDQVMDIKASLGKTKK